MRHQRAGVCLLAVVIVVLAFVPARAEGHPNGGVQPATAATASAPVEPDRQGGAASGGPAPTVLTLERQALERVDREYAPRFRELQSLAKQAKGLELVEIQKRIGALKLEQERKGLEARIEAARQAGDAERLRQLEQVAVGPATPRAPSAPAEKRPAPPQEREGGAR